MFAQCRELRKKLKVKNEVRDNRLFIPTLVYTIRRDKHEAIMILSTRNIIQEISPNSIIYVSLVHSLPNLTVLSLSGCSKVTDEGVELLAENLPRLRSLDLSWCPRVTDNALEYIACDLNHLEELTLDR